MSWGGPEREDIQTVEEGIITLIAAAREYCEAPNDRRLEALRHYGRDLSRYVRKQFPSGATKIFPELDMHQLRASLGIDR